MNGEPIMFRFRTNWRGRLILQVLVKDSNSWLFVGNGHGYGTWRDARAGDISRSKESLPVCRS